MPIELTSSQRTRLRSLARRLEPAMAVGKAGVDAGALGHVRRWLERQELLKIRLLPAAGADRKVLAEALAQAAEAALVDVVGRVVVLYRPRPGLPAHRRVQLP